jgi:hypothetical protein
MKLTHRDIRHVLSSAESRALSKVVIKILNESYEYRCMFQFHQSV